MAYLAVGRRRTSLEIVYGILSLCDNGGVMKTAIMYRNNMSYEQLQRYLSLLSTQELIHKNGDGLFQLTEGGQDTLQEVASVVRTLRGLRSQPEPATVSA